MRLHLRLIAVVLVAAGLVGAVLAATVFDTDEDPNRTEPHGQQTTEVPTGPTGETAVTGPTGTTMPENAIVPPLPIEGPLLGVNLTAYTTDGYGKPSVRRAIYKLAEFGSTAITLVPTWYMASSDANAIAPDPHKSPSEESLTKAIGWIQAAGMQVVIKPHVDVIDDSYRGDIQPADRDRWFESYTEFIDRFASLATSTSSDLFVVGTELATLSAETDRWRQLIQMVRGRFQSPITYAANWDEVDQVQFWDDLDAIGVDAYYPLSQEDGKRPKLADLVSAWRTVADGLQMKSEQWQRPVLLTEVGYPSQVGATVRPYEVTDKAVDEKLQAMAYRATFEALLGSEWLEGISWWTWRADRSPTENRAIDYTPEGKKAQRAFSDGQWAFEG